MLGTNPEKENEIDPVKFWGVSIDETAKIMAEKNVNGWSVEEAKKHVKDVLKNKIGGDHHLYFALAYAHKQGLNYYDAASYAGLLTSLITGWYGGFGTDMYEKERDIENKAIFLINRLMEIKVSHETIAEVIKIVCLDLYKR